jgi:hypothetical protein
MWGGLADADAKPRNPGKGRIILTTEEYQGRIYPNPRSGDRLDVLVKVAGIGQLDEVCGWMGGTSGGQIRRARFTWHEFKPGDPYGRCYDVDF